jgi:hypothetical protein
MTGALEANKLTCFDVPYALLLRLSALALSPYLTSHDPGTCTVPGGAPPPHPLRGCPWWGARWRWSRRDGPSRRHAPAWRLG